MTANTPSDFRIDVVSDVVCPWCYIGKRQLDAALAAWRGSHPAGPVPTVVWRPFQLSPDVPAAVAAGSILGAFALGALTAVGILFLTGQLDD